MNHTEVVEALGLEPLPDEGGWYRRTFGDGVGDACSVILYLMSARTDDEDGGSGFSAMHVLDATEVFTFVAGAPAEVLLLRPDGSSARPRLGVDLAGGESPQVVVPAGVWQGTVTLGDWTLVTTTVSPTYTDEIFRLGARDELIARWPGAADAIVARTR